MAEHLRNDRLNLIYIAGTPRCGSTLLELLLSGSDNVFALGEFRDAGLHLEEDHICHCGEKLRTCPFWCHALEGIWHSQHPVWAELGKLTDRWGLCNSSHLWSDRMRGVSDAFLSEVGRLYSTVAKTSSSHVLVDATKGAYYLYLLSQIPELSVFCIHLVRDPCAVAYSIYKRKRTGIPQYCRASPVSAALEWAAKNLHISAAIRRARIPYVQIKYLDFTTDPQNTRNAVFRKMGLAQPAGVDLSRLFAQTNNHAIGGSPSSYSQEKSRIIPDRSWQSSLPWNWAFTVRLLTYPFHPFLV